MTLNKVEKNDLFCLNNIKSIYCTDQVSSFFAYPKNKRFNLSKDKSDTVKRESKTVVRKTNGVKSVVKHNLSPQDSKRKISDKYSLFYKNRGQSFSKYKIKLMENRKIRLLYGNLSKKIVKKAFEKVKISTSWGKSCFLPLLESRLDIILYRAAFFPTIASAIQMIRSGNITVNTKKIVSPGHLLVPGDVIHVISTFPKKKDIVNNNEQRFFQNDDTANFNFSFNGEKASLNNHFFETKKVTKSKLEKIMVNKEAKLDLFLNSQNANRFLYTNYVLYLKQKFGCTFSSKNHEASQYIFSKYINKNVNKKTVKPQYLEISLRSLSIVFLYRPQNLHFTHFINLAYLLK